MSNLDQTLMRISALALKLPETYFYGRIDRHISRVRVRNYPAQTTPARPGQIRAGAHSDYVSLTILATEDKPGGLQVCKAQGDEVAMPIVPICFIINLGDLMARWTSSEWARESPGSQIVSLISNEAPKCPTTTSGEHLKKLFTTTKNPA